MDGWSDRTRYTVASVLMGVAAVLFLGVALAGTGGVYAWIAVAGLAAACLAMLYAARKAEPHHSDRAS